MTKDQVPDRSPGCSKDTREEVQEERSLKARRVEAGWDLVSPGCSRGGMEDWSYSLAPGQERKALEDELNSGCSWARPPMLTDFRVGQCNS